MSGPTEPITLYCPMCGYNLTGLMRDVCPECGVAFDRVELTASTQRRKHSHFIVGVAILSIAPMMAFCALPLGGLLARALSTLGRSSQNGSAFEVALWGYGITFVVTLLTTSVVSGRRMARRLARRYPGDPPTPTTVGATIGLAILFLAMQVAVSFVLFFAGCFVGAFGLIR